MTPKDDNPFAVEQKSRTIIGPVVKTLTLVSLCCAAAYGIHSLSRQWLIERLSFGLAEHPAHVQDERLSMLAEFGAAGLQPLVDAACSEDESLARNAYRTVVDLQSKWAAGSLRDAAAMNWELVQAIEKSASTCPPERRGILAALLNQCLIETVDSPSTKDQRAYNRSLELLAFIGPADVSINMVPSVSKDAGRQLEAADRLGNRPQMIGNTEANDTGDPVNESDSATSLSSGSLLPPLPTRLLTIDPEGSPRQLPKPLGPNWVSVEDATLAEDIVAADFDSQISNNAADTAGLGQLEPIDSLTDNPLAAYDTRSVIDFLTSPQPSLAEAAEAELRKRGFKEIELQLAYRLVAEDTEIRLALIEELPSRADVDPRSWLIWLSTDLNRQVRLEAISVLGSMNDPKIMAALRERLRTERDLVVESRIRRVLGLR